MDPAGAATVRPDATTSLGALKQIDAGATLG
jgi:hypothetical protein